MRRVPRGGRLLVRLRLDAGAPSGTIRSRTASCSPSSSRPTTSARPSTRRAAGSTRCTRSARCCSTSRASRTSSAWATSWPKTAARCPRAAATSSIPWEVLDAHGADATRWYMYTASPPGNTRRFSANLVGEVVRQVPADAVEHLQLLRHLRQPERLRPRRAPPVPLAERSVLDRWVLAELNSLVADVTAGAGNLRRDRRHAADRRLRGRTEQLVRAPEPAAVLERGCRTPRASRSAWPRTRPCTRCW